MERLRSPRVLYPLLLALGAAISAFTILRGLEPFDEGLALQSGRRILEGQWPYADFRWSYGPAEPWFLAAWFKAFGVGVLPWRLLRVAVDACTALAVFALVRRKTPLPLALAGWLTAACAMAQPTSANPFAPALLLSLLALLAATSQERSRPLLAGALIGIAAAWRLDFALYGAAGVFAALALGERSWRVLWRFSGSAIATGVLLYLPFLIDAGPGRVYDELIGVSLREHDYWTLPFPTSYDGQLRLAHAVHDFKDLLGFYVPLLLVVGAAIALAVVAIRRLPPRLAGLLVLSAGCLLYLVSRTDEFHATPLFVVLAALLPLCVFIAPRALAAGGVAVLALLLGQGLLDRGSALLRPPDLSTVEVAAADGAQVEPADARAIEAMVGDVQRLVPAGENIYVLPRRVDLVRIGDPLIYVLTERDNPTGRDFGLLARAKEQREAIAALERTRPRAIVRWTDPISAQPEPNERGRPSGILLLDRWVAEHYREYSRHGNYVVLVPPGS